MAETGKGLPRSLPGLYERVKKLEDGGGGGGSVAWGDITGKPTTFPPVAATDTVVGGVKKSAAVANTPAMTAAAATGAAGDAPTKAEFDAFVAEYNKLRTDLTNTRTTLAALITALKGAGISA